MRRRVQAGEAHCCGRSSRGCRRQRRWPRARPRKWRRPRATGPRPWRRPGLAGRRWRAGRRGLGFGPGPGQALGDQQGTEAAHRFAADADLRGPHPGRGRAGQHLMHDHAERIRRRPRARASRSPRRPRRRSANVVTRARVMDGAMVAAMLAALPPAPCSPIITPSPRGVAPAGRDQRHHLHVAAPVGGVNGVPRSREGGGPAGPGRGRAAGSGHLGQRVLAGQRPVLHQFISPATQAAAASRGAAGQEGAPG